MSYAAAMDQLISIAEGAAPVGSELGLGPRFRHDPKASPTATYRSFSFSPQGGDTPGPLTTNTRRHQVDLLLSVLYPGQNAADWDQLHRAMVGDYEVLTNAFLDVAGWNRPTSSLWEIVAGGQSTLPFQITDEGENKILIVAMSVVYTQ